MEIRLGARLGDFLDNSTAYLAMKGANKIEMEADRSLAFNAQLNLEYEGRPRNSLLIAGPVALAGWYALRTMSATLGVGCRLELHGVPIPC